MGQKKSLLFPFSRLQPVAKVLETLYLINFWLKWPVHDLVLVIPPPSLIKVASNRRPCMLKTWRNNFKWGVGGR